MASITIEVHRDEETAALLREATAAKNGKNWDRAITCLFEAKVRMGDGYPIDSRLRLPLFLQQAGRFEEAIMEFQWLIDQVRPRIERSLDQTSANVRRATIASDMAHIYDKTRLACKREKRFDEAKRYGSLSEQHRAVWQKLQPLIECEQKAKGQRADVSSDSGGGR
jgi:hypothetical protein